MSVPLDVIVHGFGVKTCREGTRPEAIYLVRS